MASVDEPLQYFQYHPPSGWVAAETRMIAEIPVGLFVNGESWLTFMCTPTHLEALGVGFLYNEEIISTAAEVSVVHVCENGCQLDVWLKHDVTKPDHWRRTSGCTGGFTATESTPIRPITQPLESLSPDMILAGMEDLLRSQEIYRTTRGVHCSMLTDGEESRILAEDIGRHNTLDKLAGRVLLEKPDLKRRLVFTTGRVSSEMLQKSARLDACAVISRTSPTALSVHLADELGITLIGYARRNQFNVYTHVERLQPSSFSIPVSIPDEPASDTR
ncbi:formate dehydrogenase family accessory protein FdhD [Longilinea arvoryzae]|uniref:Sulfur carrier protein FdhD n=1 Tax=Longilinea arvoryzae TaxID=360412 RepID=A0A0S7B9T7_9CHLR|nr:formate dehydrogenase accessory sulfurtransferase FdhD [Longilinea arvoryzae]GAP14300.1 formate dehydrogenase family accessory protein FdhD [Longilinea arvoryzae]